MPILMILIPFDKCKNYVKNIVRILLIFIFHTSSPMLCAQCDLMQCEYGLHLESGLDEIRSSVQWPPLYGHPGISIFPVSGLGVVDPCINYNFVLPKCKLWHAFFFYWCSNKLSLAGLCVVWVPWIQIGQEWYALGQILRVPSCPGCILQHL